MYLINMVMNDILDDNLIQKSNSNKIKNFAIVTTIISLIFILGKFIKFIQIYMNIDSVLIPVNATLSLLIDSMILGATQTILLIVSFLFFHKQHYKYSFIVNTLIIILNYILPYIYSVN